jgi:hypothetical protein
MTRLLIAAAILPLGFGAAADREPRPLAGTPLAGETGLRLVVAGARALQLDVDRGTAAPIRGIPAKYRGILFVVGVAGRAAIVMTSSVSDQRIYAVSGGARLSYLGVGRAAVAAQGGRSVWILRGAKRSQCSLRQIGLDGRHLRTARPFPCAGTMISAGPLGLVVNRVRLVDPVTGRTIRKTRWGVLATAGNMLVLAGPGKQFTLLNGVSGAERRLRWPSILSGLDRPAVDPRGRFVALAFADPAWNGGGAQALDVWLLDTKSGGLTQLPGMPAFVSLKRTSMAWTDDGRLVLLAEANGKEFVVVWRTGQRQLALKTVKLERSGGSDSFAPLSAR